jgi:hypothetical protein
LLFVSRKKRKTTKERRGSDPRAVLGACRLCVFRLFILELTAARAIAEEHIAQLLGYLRAANLEHGAVLNFGSGKFAIRKLAMSAPEPPPSSASKLLSLLLSSFLVLFGDRS